MNVYPIENECVHNSISTPERTPPAEVRHLVSEPVSLQKRYVRFKLLTQIFILTRDYPALHTYLAATPTGLQPRKNATHSMLHSLGSL